MFCCWNPKCKKDLSLVRSVYKVDTIRNGHASKLSFCTEFCANSYQNKTPTKNLTTKCCWNPKCKKDLSLVRSVYKVDTIRNGHASKLSFCTESCADSYKSKQNKAIENESNEDEVIENKPNKTSEFRCSYMSRCLGVKNTELIYRGEYRFCSEVCSRLHLYKNTNRMHNFTCIVCENTTSMRYDLYLTNMLFDTCFDCINASKQLNK